MGCDSCCRCAPGRAPPVGGHARWTRADCSIGVRRIGPVGLPRSWCSAPPAAGPPRQVHRRESIPAPISLEPPSSSSLSPPSMALRETSEFDSTIPLYPPVSLIGDRPPCTTSGPRLPPGRPPLTSSSSSSTRSANGSLTREVLLPQMSLAAGASAHRQHLPARPSITRGHRLWRAPSSSARSLNVVAGAFFPCQGRRSGGPPACPSSRSLRAPPPSLSAPEPAADQILAALRILSPAPEADVISGPSVPVRTSRLPKPAMVAPSPARAEGGAWRRSRSRSGRG